MTSFVEIERRLSRFAGRTLGRGASADELAHAEVALGANIVGTYRDFLKHLGWASVGHLEIFGLGVDVPPFLQLVTVTLSERGDMHPPLPAYLIPFLNDGGGNLYCIDASARGEPPVVFWDHEGGAQQVPSESAQSFAEWLITALDQMSP